MLAALMIVTVASIGATLGYVFSRIRLGADAGLIAALLVVFVAVYFTKPGATKR